MLRVLAIVVCLPVLAVLGYLASGLGEWTTLVLVALLLPAVQSAREAARRMQCSNNMKQIALALYNYESIHKSFPPAFTTDASGKPLHSWRTLILPYMEQSALYNQIDLNKPWDDPVNLPFSQVVIPTYACPSGHTDSPEKTCYQVVIDPSGIFTGPAVCNLSTISDGTSNTILVVETESQNAVPWMAPSDTDLPTFLARGQSRSSHHTGGGNVAIADGSVVFLSDSVDPKTASSMVSKAGGELVSY